jgi:hypothetical protein
MESEARMNKLMLLGVTVMACLPAVAGADVIYQYDANTPDGYGPKGFYTAWLAHFNVQPGGDTINAVELSLRTPGSCEVVVWKDTGGDGDPKDAEVVRRKSFDGVAGPNTVPITPVTVTESFFVGGYSFVARCNTDTSGYESHRSWLSLSDSSSGLDLNDLDNAAYISGWIEDVGYLEVVMVRAQATPEPATMALLAAGGAAALLRRRRK